MVMARNRSRLRIGDHERDAAVTMLQEHHALGRLEPHEFNERVDRALRARTQSQIDELFVDLPDPKPAVPEPANWPAPVLSHPGEGPLVPAMPEAKRSDPWYAQWWMILAAISVAAVVQGPFAVIVPLMAIWLWVIYPNLPATKRRRQLDSPGSVRARLKTADYAKDLTPNQRRAISRELQRGRRISAIAMYQDFTRTTRPYATDVIKTWQRDLKR